MISVVDFRARVESFKDWQKKQKSRIWELKNKKNLKSVVAVAEIKIIYQISCNLSTV